MCITAELEANHLLLSCGSLVRKGWRVEFDNRMSVSHAGLGGCSLVELRTLFSRNIGWIYSRSLAVDVASANDDFSFAYMVGERQGGETVGRSWAEQHGGDEPAIWQPAVISGEPYMRSVRGGPVRGDAGRGRDSFPGEEGGPVAGREPVQRRERDAAAELLPAPALSVTVPKVKRMLRRPETKKMPTLKGSLLVTMAKAKLKETRAVASRPGPEPKPTGESTSASASVNQNDVWSRLGISAPPPVPAKVVLTPRKKRSCSPLPRHKRKRRQGR